MTSRAPTTVKGRATRERVLVAANALIRERGAADVTLDDVQAAAGVGRSQLYHYFTGRDDLIRAAVQSSSNLVVEHSSELLDGLDSVADIERWFGFAEQTCTAGGGVGGCPIGSLVPQLSERDDQARQVLASAFDRWQAPLTEGLAHMREQGVLRPDCDPAQLADLIMAALQGGLLLAQVRRDPAQLGRALDGARAALRLAAAP